MILTTIEDLLYSRCSINHFALINANNSPGEWVQNYFYIQEYETRTKRFQVMNANRSCGARL